MLPKPLIEALAEVIWENEKTRALILEIAREGEKSVLHSFILIKTLLHSKICKVLSVFNLTENHRNLE